MKKLGTGSKGITLVALVVTIIVILIIAGVSLWTLRGDSNIINQARNARDLSTQSDAEAEVKEQWLLVQNDYKKEYPTNTELATELQKRLTKKDDSATVVSNGNNSFNISYKGYNFTVYSNNN